jgi:hypothetical protein
MKGVLCVTSVIFRPIAMILRLAYYVIFESPRVTASYKMYTQQF